MSPPFQLLRVIAGRISGATTSKAAAGLLRLTAWLTKTSIERVIAASWAGVSFGCAAAGAANARATNTAATTFIGTR